MTNLATLVISIIQINYQGKNNMPYTWDKLMRKNPGDLLKIRNRLLNRKGEIIKWKSNLTMQILALQSEIKTLEESRFLVETEIQEKEA